MTERKPGAPRATLVLNVDARVVRGAYVPDPDDEVQPLTLPLDAFVEDKIELLASVLQGGKNLGELSVIAAIERSARAPVIPIRPKTFVPPPRSAVGKGPKRRLSPELCYVLRESLGATSECMLHSALDTEHDRLVVVKRMLPEAAEDPVRRRRFLKEAAIGVSFSHPHLLEVFDHGTLEGVPFVSRQRVDGATLRALTVSSARPSLAAMLTLAHQAAGALAYLHTRCDEAGASHHLAHGDLSPESIFVTRDGTVKLTEGVLTFLDEKLLRSSNGGIGGRSGYQSPEQVAGQGASSQADVFALGLVIVELISGVPFVVDGAALPRIDRMIRARCARVEGVSTDLLDLLLRMTAADAADRPQAPAVSEALVRVMADVGPPPDLADEVADFFAEIAPLPPRKLDVIEAEIVEVASPKSDARAPDRDDPVYVVVDEPRKAQRAPRPRSLVSVVSLMVAGALTFWLLRRLVGLIL